MPHAVVRLSVVRWGMGALAIVIAACSTPTGTCACSPPELGVAVRGAVLRPDGAPVADAWVRSEIFAATCPTAGMGAPTGPVTYTRTGATGRFAAFQRSTAIEAACVRVAVLADTTATSLPLVQADRAGVSVWRRDSVSVTLTIP